MSVFFVKTEHERPRAMNDEAGWSWREINAVVFDAVGTLLDPNPSVAMAYVEAAQRQGVELDRAEVKRRFSTYFRVDEVDESKGPMATDESLEWKRWRRIVGNVLPELPDIERAFAELWDHFGRPSAWRLFDDVPEAVALLKEAGIPFVIASNFDARLRSVLQGFPELGVTDDSVVISSLVGYRKPHPLFYQAVVDVLGIPAPRILSVGDDLENDVLGPTRAGFRAVQIERGGEKGNLVDLFKRGLSLSSTGETLARGR